MYHNETTFSATRRANVSKMHLRSALYPKPEAELTAIARGEEAHSPSKNPSSVFGLRPQISALWA